MTTKKLKDKKCIKKLLPLKANSLEEESQLQDGTKALGMKIDLMAIVILVMDLVTWLWIVHSKKEEMLEVEVIK